MVVQLVSCSRFGTGNIRFNTGIDSRTDIAACRACDLHTAFLVSAPFLLPASICHLGDQLKGYEIQSKAILFLWNACVQRVHTSGLPT